MLRTMRWVVITVLAIAAVAIGEPKMAQAAVTGPGRACVHGSQPPTVSGGSMLDGVAVVSACDGWAVGWTTGGATYGTLIENWNGSTWTQVPSPSRSGANNYLDSVSVVTASNIWADGYSQNDNEYRTLVLHWNGLKWRMVTSPDPDPGDSMLEGIWAASAQNVWAVGSTGATTSHALIEHWNGHRWSASLMPNPKGSKYGTYLTAVAGRVAGHHPVAWATGDYCARRRSCAAVYYGWTGIKWRRAAGPALPAPEQTFTFGISVSSATSAWAVGSFTKATSNRALIEHWNGKQWRLVALGQALPANSASELLGVTSSGDSVLAVGDDDVTSLQSALTVAWNGQHWTRRPSPDPLGAGLNYSFAAVAGGTCGNAWEVGAAFVVGANQNAIAAHC
jgi:hypothetical protein